ncbi:hypothetical protein GQR58_016537 [Nymphon striatum]|nr:hypothetical protein GQR58_016537 [Nymphon striatum]
MRFPEDDQNIIDAFSVLGLRSIPFIQGADLHNWGKQKLETLIDFYGKQHTRGNATSAALIDPQQCRAEWSILKQLVQTEEYPTQSMACLWGCINQYHPQDFPHLKTLASIALVAPVHTANSERGFSVQNNIKSSLRNRLSPVRLHQLTLISIEGPPRKEFPFHRAVKVWKKKSRKILPMRKNDQKEPLLPREFPQRPWEHVGSDLFYLKDKWYVLMIDYYSRYVDVGLLENLHSHGVINQLKSIFARHGVPKLLTSDNGPQYASKEFEEFYVHYGFQHSTSSPKYPQSNGEAERAVQTVKNIFKKESDPYLALLAYRPSPLANGKSPAELLINRKLRSTSIPCITKVLDKIITDTSDISAKENVSRNQEKSHYDNRFRVHEQPDLTPGETVWVKDLKRSGVVFSPWKGSPRSFNVKSDGETVRRNRRSLITLPLSDGNENSPNIATPEDDSKDISLRTSSYGRPIRPTKIFDFKYKYIPLLKIQQFSQKEEREYQSEESHRKLSNRNWIFKGNTRFILKKTPGVVDFFTTQLTKSLSGS